MEKHAKTGLTVLGVLSGVLIWFISSVISAATGFKRK